MLKNTFWILLSLFILNFEIQAKKPNVLFIAVDDLNHWVTHLGRNPQAQTPNIDRLAKMGVSFTNAHCAVPACEPSRLALMGGKRPWTTGGYRNGVNWMNVQKDGEGLSAQFLKAGYYVAGAGKIYHSMKHHESEWTEYMPNTGKSWDGVNVQKLDGFHIDKTHPKLKDEDLIDWHTTNYCIERIKKKRDKPFFIACGLYKPHLPFVVPRKYYKAFPLESIQHPPHKKDDLNDIPKAGLRMARPKHDHARFLENGRWKAAIQSYLATCAYTDMNIGRLLDALESSPNKDNTIVVLWGDHGWSFGEKQHWRKFALWEETTRTPLIWVVPGMTKAGSQSQKPVDLMSIYPTLCSLTGIKKPSFVEGHDITPLLKNPEAQWDKPAITTHYRGNHAVRSEDYRYIRYADGSEELYDHRKDPYEWNNIATLPGLADLKIKMASHLPVKEVPEIPVPKKKFK